MRKKIITAILSITLLVCVGGNIYQNMTASKLRESLSELSNAKNELTAEIENKTIELNTVTSEIETANTTIEELTAAVDSLTSEINATQSKIDGINSTHTDIILGDDEYKGDTGADAIQSEYENLSKEEQEIVDQIVEDLMKEHPEWSTDDSSGTSPAPYQGPAVGTPDNGELPNTGRFGQGDYSELGDNVTVY